jgi:DNA-directed RNA polymerase specialized sigma24 family protein
MTTNDDAFEEFLIRLEPNIPSSSQRYARLRNRLIKFFEWRHCRDREGLTDETIERLLKHINARDEIGKPWSYVYAVATNVYREYSRKAARLVDIKNDLESLADDSDDFIECARICLEKLSNDKRRLVEQYYLDEGSRVELARQEGVSLAALRLKIHRMKTELKECYSKCMRGQIS